MSHRWTNAFLDNLRQQGDWAADACFARMVQDGEIAHARDLFSHLNFNNTEAVINTVSFPAIHDFFEATRNLPPHTDRNRIQRAENLFTNHLYPSALVMLCQSLPEGYSAKCLSEILNLSGALEHHPFRRLMGVMQMVLNATVNRGLAPDGCAIVTAQKVRLLHAGIRHIADEYLPHYRTQYGVPVNHEDMLATIMGFSYLIIMGLRRLGIALQKEEEEDIFYLWRIFSLTMGIHPQNEPNSFAYIPDNVEDAGFFYQAYVKRHYVSASENPIGVALAQANIKMIEGLMPKAVHKLVENAIHIYTYQLIGPDGCARVGITPPTGHRILQKILHSILPLADDLSHHEIARLMFQHLINEEYGGHFTFWIPDSMETLKEMNEEPSGEQEG